MTAHQRPTLASLGMIAAVMAPIGAAIGGAALEQIGVPSPLSTLMGAATAVVVTVTTVIL